MFSKFSCFKLIIDDRRDSQADAEDHHKNEHRFEAKLVVSKADNNWRAASYQRALYIITRVTEVSKEGIAQKAARQLHEEVLPVSLAVDKGVPSFEVCFS